MKEGWKWGVSVIIWITSILALILVYQSRADLPNDLVVILLLALFVTGAVAGFSSMIYSKPRFRGFGLRDEKEIEEDEREMNEPYYHH